MDDKWFNMHFGYFFVTWLDDMLIGHIWFARNMIYKSYVALLYFPNEIGGELGWQRIPCYLQIRRIFMKPYRLERI